MRLCLRPISLVLLFYFIHGTSGVCQYASVDTAAVQQAKNNAIKQYFNYVGNESVLYNGQRYIVYTQTIQYGSPYYLVAGVNVDTMSYPGSVTYWGVDYTNAQLAYDVYKAKLLVIMPVTNYPIIMATEKVSAFTLGSHAFVNMHGVADKKMKDGFYEVLYSGNNVSLYESFGKKREEKVSSTGSEVSLIDYEDYFIKKGDAYFSLNSKSDLLHVFADRKKDMQDFLKKNKLNIKRDKTHAFAAAAAYYDKMFSSTKN